MRRYRPAGAREQLLVGAGARTASPHGTAVSRMLQGLQQQAGNQAVVQLLKAPKGHGAAGKLDLDDQTGIPVEAVGWAGASKLVETLRAHGQTEYYPAALVRSDLELTRVPDEHSAALSPGATFKSGALHLANKGGGGTMAMGDVRVFSIQQAPGFEKVKLSYGDLHIAKHGAPMRASKGTLVAGPMKAGAMSWSLDDQGLTVRLRSGGDAEQFNEALANHFVFSDVTVKPRYRSGGPAVTLPGHAWVVRVGVESEKGVPSFEVRFANPERAKRLRKDIVSPG